MQWSFHRSTCTEAAHAVARQNLPGGAAAGTVLCGPPPSLSLFFRSVRGLPRWPSATFFPSIQSLRGPATLGLRGSHAWGGGGECQKVSGLVVRTDPRAWDRATLEAGKPAVRGASPATFRVTCPSPRRGPEEIEILRCTQRRRSPRATRGGFARDTWLLQPTERVP